MDMGHMMVSMEVEEVNKILGMVVEVKELKAPPSV